MKLTKSLLVILILFSHCSSNPENIPQSESSRLSKENLRSAEQGDTLAQYNLGLKYQNGQGVSEDQQEAFKWYELAAKQGHPQAQANLGWMYEKGQGTPQDYQKALQWYRLAAGQDVVEAQFNLGFMLSLIHI